MRQVEWQVAMAWKSNRKKKELRWKKYEENVPFHELFVTYLCLLYFVRSIYSSWKKVGKYWSTKRLWMHGKPPVKRRKVPGKKFERKQKRDVKKWEPHIRMTFIQNEQIKYINFSISLQWTRITVTDKTEYYPYQVYMHGSERRYMRTCNFFHFLSIWWVCSTSFARGKVVCVRISRSWRWFALCFTSTACQME